MLFAAPLAPGVISNASENVSDTDTELQDEYTIYSIVSDSVNEHSIPSQMYVKDEDYYTYLYLEPDQKRINIISDFKAESSNPQVLDAQFKRENMMNKVILKALSPGTATLTVTNERNLEKYVYDITVIPQTEGVIEALDMNPTFFKGKTFPFTSHGYWINYGNEKKLFRMTECSIVSSNPEVISVIEERNFVWDKSYKLFAKKEGTAQVTITVNTQDGLVKDFVRTMNITVTASEKCSTPVMVSPMKTEIGSTWINVIFNMIVGPEVEYEIYRSNKKNTGFTKVGSVKIKKSTNSTPYVNGSMSGSMSLLDETYTYVDKKKVKQNKQYYYKIRARYCDPYSSHSEEWSDFTKVQSYWTALKCPKNNKIRYTLSGKDVWPKAKGAVSYVYNANAIVRRGYNIFGKPILSSWTDTIVAKKNKVTIHKVKAGVKINNLSGVCPITKHGKYYYAEGYLPQKKLKSYIHYDK